MNIKDFLFRHVEKCIVSIIVCYSIYTVHTLMVLNGKTKEIDAKLQSLSDVIGRRLRTGAPPDIHISLTEADQLRIRFTTPANANPLPRFQIFSKFSREEMMSGITTEDLLKKDLLSHPRLEVAEPGDVEFIFKGGTADLAMIQVRKLCGNVWWTKGFMVEKGKTIGEKTIVKKETIDFSTCCKLIEIVPSAQKLLSVKRTNVLRDENGNFLGTSITEESQSVTSSKIVFEYKGGKLYELWIGELVNLGLETATVHPPVNVSFAN